MKEEQIMHGTFSDPKHLQIEPAILYFGTPVVLIGSTNEDGSFNLAPMSSAWWVGWRCMLGRNSKTTENMIRSGECVLNLPSADLVGAVDSLARTTGSNPVPPGKIKRGYRHAKEKFAISSLTALPGETSQHRVPPNARCRWRGKSRMSRKWLRRTISGAAISSPSRFASPACTRIRES
jgi:flavin reductase (DIM6/NTAB) family NADH-FMN oxidoreductase RutF